MPVGDDRFNLTDMRYNLAHADNLTFVKTFGNDAVYENQLYDPLVYAADMVNIGNQSPTNVITYIENNVIDITNTAVYSNSSGVYNSTDKMNVAAIPSFSEPGIDFVENDPTSVTVSIHNATTPFYLVFRETYDPYSVASYSNGTAVSDVRHLEVNGFANAWYVDKKGDYTVTLYYSLQTIGWASWIISFAGLGAICYVGYLAFRHNAKYRKGNKKGKITGMKVRKR